ncbi:hypothetical protein WJX74_000062 [Apatococcus lobatus]|uniref:Uncharacterized protein n=1 Tax=Apatococcus lobatus TaxID=904363 RepID=A0AAW1QN57_9CHLO
MLQQALNGWEKLHAGDMADAMERIQTSSAELQEAQSTMATLRQAIAENAAGQAAALEALETKHAADMKMAAAEHADAAAAVREKHAAELSARHSQHTSKVDLLMAQLSEQQSSRESALRSVDEKKKHGEQQLLEAAAGQNSMQATLGATERRWLAAEQQLQAESTRHAADLTALRQDHVSELAMLQQHVSLKPDTNTPDNNQSGASVLRVQLAELQNQVSALTKQLEMSQQASRQRHDSDALVTELQSSVKHLRTELEAAASSELVLADACRQADSDKQQLQQQLHASRNDSDALRNILDMPQPSSETIAHQNSQVTPQQASELQLKLEAAEAGARHSSEECATLRRQLSEASQSQHLLQREVDGAHQATQSRTQAEAELQEAQGLLHSQAQTMAVLTAELNASQVQIADLLQSPQDPQHPDTAVRAERSDTERASEQEQQLAEILRALQHSQTQCLELQSEVDGLQSQLQTTQQCGDQDRAQQQNAAEEVEKAAVKLEKLTAALPFWVQRIGQQREMERAWLTWRLASSRSQGKHAAKTRLTFASPTRTSHCQDPVWKPSSKLTALEALAGSPGSGPKSDAPHKIRAQHGRLDRTQGPDTLAVAQGLQRELQQLRQLLMEPAGSKPSPTKMPEPEAAVGRAKDEDDWHPHPARAPLKVAFMRTISDDDKEARAVAESEGPDPGIREVVRQRIAALEGVVASICGQLGDAQQELNGLHSPTPGEQAPESPAWLRSPDRSIQLRKSCSQTHAALASNQPECGAPTLPVPTHADAILEQHGIPSRIHGHEVTNCLSAASQEEGFPEPHRLLDMQQQQQLCPEHSDLSGSNAYSPRKQHSVIMAINKCSSEPEDFGGNERCPLASGKSEARMAPTANALQPDPGLLQADAAHPAPVNGMHAEREPASPNASLRNPQHEPSQEASHPSSKPSRNQLRPAAVVSSALQPRADADRRTGQRSLPYAETALFKPLQKGQHPQQRGAIKAHRDKQGPDKQSFGVRNQEQEARGEGKRPQVAASRSGDPSKASIEGLLHQLDGKARTAVSMQKGRRQHQKQEAGLTVIYPRTIAARLFGHDLQ